MHAFIWSSSIHPFSSTVGERSAEKDSRICHAKNPYIYVSSSMILFYAYATDLWPWFIYLFICVYYICSYSVGESWPGLRWTKQRKAWFLQEWCTSHHMAPLMCSCVSLIVQFVWCSAQTNTTEEGNVRLKLWVLEVGGAHFNATGSRQNHIQVR